MAKTFYYDSVGLTESTLNDGTYSSGPDEFTDGTTITNEERVVDMSISTAPTDWATSDALQFNLGSAKDVSFIAMYFNATETSDISLYADDSASGTLDNTAVDITSSFSVGWNISTFSSLSKQYWVLNAQSGAIEGLTEVILGEKLEFENEPDIGIATQEIFATDLNTSYGGVEYANKRHDPKTTWQLNFSNISTAFKNNLVRFETEVTNYKKFVYYDDSSYHYVRLDSPIKFTEVAFQRFSASLKLREQLS